MNHRSFLTTPHSNPAPHFLAWAGVHCVPTSTMDTAVFLRSVPLIARMNASGLVLPMTPQEPAGRYFDYPRKRVIRAPRFGVDCRRRNSFSSCGYEPVLANVVHDSAGGLTAPGLFSFARRVCQDSPRVVSDGQKFQVQRSVVQIDNSTRRFQCPIAYNESF